MERSQSSREAEVRVVLLGASNLTRGFARAFEIARERLGAPLEVLAALGHGRSFGLESSFLARSLPGIEACGLWRALENGAARATHALVTDIGNDVAFGVEPSTIAAWVEDAVAKLEREGARTILTALPLANLERLAPWKFELWRRFFFPGRALERELVLERAAELDRLVRDLARRRGLALVEPDPDWYAADPIHIARNRIDVAWREILGAWPQRTVSVEPERKVSRGLRWRTRFLVPERRRLLGFEQTRQQPCARLADGSTIALY